MAVQETVLCSGAEGDRWLCRRLFYVVPLKTLFNCLIT